MYFSIFGPDTRRSANAAWRLVGERINALRLYHIRLGSELWQERTRRLFDLAGELP